MLGKLIMFIGSIYYSLLLFLFFPALVDSFKGLLRGEPPTTLYTLRSLQKSFERNDEKKQVRDRRFQFGFIHLGHRR